MPQGGVLSPFLWNLVIDPLLIQLKQLYQGQAYADDLSVTHTGDPFENIIRRTKITAEEIIEWGEKTWA